MANTKPKLQDQVYRKEHHGRTTSRVFHRVQRAGQLDHTKPESAEVVPGEFEHDRRGLHSVGEAQQGELHY